MTSIDPNAMADPEFESIRVLVVDDSVVARGSISRILENESDIEIVGSASNGQMAQIVLNNHPAEVAVLDIEMPIMNGIEALPHLLKIDPNLKVLVVSALTRRNAELVLQALDAGAADCMAKPESDNNAVSLADFALDLVRRIRGLSEARRKRLKKLSQHPDAISTSRLSAAKPSHPTLSKARSSSGVSFELRRPSSLRPKILAIGSSTGGPQAVRHVIQDLIGKVTIPILITQHMPPTFTSIMAEHIKNDTGLDCREAVDGEALTEGRIYIAPGDYHMIVEGKNGSTKLRLLKTEPENYCRPAVDPMLRSLVEVFGGQILTVILTGMGHDGLKGSQAVVEAGGTVIAQDEETSVVWGMPRSVALAGLCSAVLPIERIGSQINTYISGSV